MTVNGDKKGNKPNRFTDWGLLASCSLIGARCLVPAIATQWSNCQCLHRETPSSRGPGCSQLVMIQRLHFSSRGGMIRIEVWTWVFCFCFFKQNKTLEYNDATSSFVVQIFHLFPLRESRVALSSRPEHLCLYPWWCDHGQSE